MAGDDDARPPACRTCLKRPARPGSAYCSAFCRLLAVLHRLRVLTAPATVTA